MFINMQNINFINQILLEILQRHFEYFRYTWPHPSIMMGIKYQFIDNCACLHKKIIFMSRYFLDILYCKDIANLLFWVIWAGLAMRNKITGINLQESLLICIQKKSTSSLPCFLRYCKEIANLLFGQFEYA